MGYKENLDRYSNYFYSFKVDYENANQGDYYFSRDSLRAFGERISDFRILSETATIIDVMGRERECFVLSKTQRDSLGYINGGRRFRVYDWFDVETLERVFPK